jgi:thiamine biosynthesis lipoprotein
VIADVGSTRQGRRAEGDSLLRHAVPSMGTVFSFAIGAPYEVAAPRGRVGLRFDPDTALADAAALLERLDGAWSPFRPDSFVARLRAYEELDGRVEDPDGALGLDLVLRRCRAAQRLTHGAFDAWGLPDGFDPSGVVKGWAVERAVALLAARGITDVAVSGGGDVTVRGRVPGRDGWRIGVRDPHKPGALLGSVLVRGGGAVATSGFYERGAHILDPRKIPLAAPAGDLVAVTVAGPELGWCDVIAKAILVEGTSSPGWLASIPTYRVLAVHSDATLDGALLEELETASDEAGPVESPGA